MKDEWKHLTNVLHRHNAIAAKVRECFYEYKQGHHAANRNSIKRLAPNVFQFIGSRIEPRELCAIDRRQFDRILSLVLELLGGMVGELELARKELYATQH